MRCARLWFLGILCLTPTLAIDCSGATYNAETKASCINGVQDIGETDIDCGGPGCPACSRAKICAVDQDCGAALSCRPSPKDATGTKRCIATHCLNLVRDSDETDIDCGGSCSPCTSGLGCRTGADCDSLTCAGDLCSPADCSDGKLNQDESDLDCGSILTAATCKTCAAGQKCVEDDNCESRLCKAGLCQPVSCADARKNGDEGGVDCGGSCKTRCPESSTCNVPTDCASNVCRAGLCLSPYCGDGAANGGESDVDCGGPCGSTCLPGLACQSDRDCSTAFCNSAHVCGIPTCTDGLKNQDESDVDCGDPRGICPRCKATQLCAATANCESGICADGRCTERSCSDRVKNGAEGDIDCGGNCPNRCKSGQSCAEMADCESSVCTNRLCAAASCGDGVKNGTETGPDCGGSTCASKCDIGIGCTSNSDCKINSCASGKCADPLCNNAMADGTETDVDCGGDRCGKCTATKHCIKDTDCNSLNCGNLICIAETCSDRIQNGRETFTDCGGDCPLKCEANQPCAVGTDCKSGVCNAGVCKAPACDDLVKNGLETDADCGGASCSALPSPKLCAKGQGCSSDSDCKAALVCDASQGKCVDWSCTDLRKNQDETDIDCGGTFCPGCITDRTCRAATDCKDRICTNGRCAAPSCTDQVRNSIEGDIDCGGGCPKKCKDNSLCNLGADCESGVCSATSPQICLAPSCSDKVKNQDETDTDCGGSCTNKCADGKICKTNVDCANPLSTCTPTGDASVCTPPGCADNSMKGDETDVDCGGPICSPCGVGQNCKLDRDCVVIESGKCLIGACAAASCSDMVQNGAESDIDCGGAGALGYPLCKTCQAGQKCGTGDDCDSGHCVGSLCQPASCLDGTKNGGEYGIDCGSVCAGQKTNPGCPDDTPCAVDADCSGGWCNNKICKTRTCSDGVANGAEGDKDCGAICPSKPCPMGGGCKIDADCAPGSTCSECQGKCIKVAKGCYVNPATDANCYQCASGQTCSNDTDCQSLHCDSTGHCGSVDSCIGGLLNDADGNFSDGSAICASTERDRCYAFLRCLFANNCTPSDPCFTPPEGTNTPCGWNAGIGSSTAHRDAAKTWDKASCKAPTNP